MAIAARIKKRMSVATRVTFIHVSTQRFGSACLNGAHHPQMLQRQIMRLSIRRAIFSKDIRHFKTARSLR
jgi:hypothetical protein